MLGSRGKSELPKLVRATDPNKMAKIINVISCFLSNLMFIEFITKTLGTKGLMMLHHAALGSARFLKCLLDTDDFRQMRYTYK